MKTIEAQIIRTGFSPCPNDTFMFDALVHRRVGPRPWTVIPVMEDIESLNLRAVERGDELAVTKLSVAALGHCAERYRVLPVGAALGRGVGPLVVRRAEQAGLDKLEDLAGRRVAVPGRYTTANLLLRSFAPEQLELVVLPFDQIMDAVAQGHADAGVVIHEGRFTFAAAGLAKVADLGEVWEGATGLPLPLGLICAQRSLGEALTQELCDALRESIEAAFAEPGAAWPWIREHSQELSEQVCRDHIALYVNDFSLDLGEEGRAAVDEMFSRACAAGVFPAKASPW